ncbi:MAG: 2-C-methyl-D-erythritol 4-phosphate cytidylyltransferase [Treponema sp.]|nr:2-C-methyl-D-erythritol 4-phosphate cytidylyltransferase [Treponema sp.]
METRIAAIVTAAGSSNRMAGLKKEYLPLSPPAAGPEGCPKGCPKGRPLTVLGAAVSAFAALPDIALIVITFPPDSGEETLREALPRNLGRPGVEFPLFLTPGGLNRRESVYRALRFLEPHRPGYVLIHDGARPWVSAALIRRVIEGTLAQGAAVPVLPLTETPKELDGRGFIKSHLRRASIAVAQTPQGFAYPAMLRAHEEAARRAVLRGEYTDDAEVWAGYSGPGAGPLAAVPGEAANRKITFPEDLL